MKPNINKRVGYVAAGAMLALTLTLSSIFLAGSASARRSQSTQDVKQNSVVASFEQRVKAYSKLREGLEEKLPKLPKESTPEQIQAHKTAFEEMVRAARAGVKPGNAFTPDIAEHIRATIRAEFNGAEMRALRETVLEADTKGVIMRVNYPYPDDKELVEMPPTLLLKFPQLPKQVRYRFVNRHLLLVDRENGLIVDYMPDAIPSKGGGGSVAETQGENSPVATAVSSPPAASTVKLTLPLKDGSVRFMVVGDTGTGSEQQKELADLMLRYRTAFPFEFVLMMGDNMYGGEKPEDFKAKFEDVYKKLLDDKVKFYATLGNHDESNQRFYDYFNMKGEEYYRLTKGNVSFYSLNSNYMDKRQVKWMEDEMSKDTADWKIVFLHHPPYSSGKKHGSSSSVREVVEPIFLKYGVNAVFAGHEHFYERIKPQKGIYYFISGAGGKLRPGDVKKDSPLTEKAFDQDMSFMLLEVVKDEMHFQVVSRTGEIVDSGVIANQRKKAATAAN